MMTASACFILLTPECTGSGVGWDIYKQGDGFGDGMHDYGDWYPYNAGPHYLYSNSPNASVYYDFQYTGEE